MKDEACSLAQLDEAATREKDRLGRLGDAFDPREEMQHRVWPFLCELMATLRANEEEEEPAALPIDAALRVAMVLGELLNVAKAHLPAAEYAQQVAAVDQVIGELLSYVDEEGRAQFERFLVERPTDAAADLPPAAPPTVADGDAPNVSP